MYLFLVKKGHSVHIQALRDPRWQMLSAKCCCRGVHKVFVHMGFDTVWSDVAAITGYIQGLKLFSHKHLLVWLNPTCLNSLSPLVPSIWAGVNTNATAYAVFYFYFYIIFYNHILDIFFWNFEFIWTIFDLVSQDIFFLQCLKLCVHCPGFPRIIIKDYNVDYTTAHLLSKSASARGDSNSASNLLLIFMSRDPPPSNTWAPRPAPKEEAS